MDKFFPERYARAYADPRQEQLELRWQGVEECAKAIAIGQLPQLLLLTRGRPADPSFVNLFRDFFRAKDVNFKLRDNDYELQILAAEVALRLVKETPTARGDFVALASVTSGFLGLIPTPIELKDLMEASKEVLTSREIGIRKRRQLVPPVRERYTEALKAFLEKTGDGQPVTVTDATKALLREIGDEFLEMARHQNDVVRYVDEAQRTTEELNGLTLLYVSRYSDPLRATFEEAGNARPIAVAVELARITRFNLGLPNAVGYVDQLMQLEPPPSDPMPMNEAIDGVPMISPIENAATGLPGPLVPMSFCLTSSARDEDWRSIAAESLGLAIQPDRAANEWAMQLYNELVLAKAFEDLTTSGL